MSNKNNDKIEIDIIPKQNYHMDLETAKKRLKHILSPEYKARIKKLDKQLGGIIKKPGPYGKFNFMDLADESNGMYELINRLGLEFNSCYFNDYCQKSECYKYTFFEESKRYNVDYPHERFRMKHDIQLHHVQEFAKSDFSPYINMDIIKNEAPSFYKKVKREKIYLGEKIRKITFNKYIGRLTPSDWSKFDNGISYEVIFEYI